MLKKVYLITCFLIAAISSAQFHEIGVFFGGSNYIGDVGSDRYLDPNQIAYGLLYKWNVTDRYSFRGGFTLTKLKENELNNRVINRSRRSYEIENSIQEFTAGIEINFKNFKQIQFDISSSRLGHRISSYLYNIRAFCCLVFLKFCSTWSIFWFIFIYL